MLKGRIPSTNSEIFESVTSLLRKSEPISLDNTVNSAHIARTYTKPFTAPIAPPSIVLMIPRMFPFTRESNIFENNLSSRYAIIKMINASKEPICRLQEDVLGDEIYYDLRFSRAI